MRKRLSGILPILCMMLAMLPTTVLVATADNENYHDSDVTWLGTTSEYQKTLKVFFDDSGLRKVIVNGKCGLVDMTGAFLVQPIYDQIEAYYRHKERGNTVETNKNLKAETIFINGYVQAIRNGKMGLLDKTGREVIPCVYDAVGLPSEGVCRISKKINGKTYLGYWNLELGREIVAPNKYLLPEAYAFCGTAAGGMLSMFGNRFYIPDANPEGLEVAFNFYKGYALVLTGKVVKVTEKCESNRNTRQRLLAYAQIIDKNGREVLPGGPYPFCITPTYSSPYPQAGPYMVYDQLSTKRMRMVTDLGDEIIYTSHLESGIVGPQGIVVPAQYHGGINGNEATGFYPVGAGMQLIPEFSLALTSKCSYDFKQSAAAKPILINFSNQTIIPFGSVTYLSYDHNNKVFVSEHIYRPDGTKIPGTAIRRELFPMNGYVSQGDQTGVKGVTSVITGKSYTHENLKGSATTSVSIKDTLWVKKGNKWGLVNINGQIILPFEYEEVDAFAWLDPTTPYAKVKKNGKWGMVDTSGKFLLPCDYRSIGEGEDGYINIQDAITGNYGIYNLNTFQITTPCISSEVINNVSFVADGFGSIGGTIPYQVGNSLNALFDMDAGKLVTTTYLVMKPSSRGLFINTFNDKFGPDGRIVFSRAEDAATHTLVVKDGKVGSINASRLKIGGKLPTTPYVKPVPEPINPRGFIVTYPETRVYLLGDRFDMKGLIVHEQDADGVRSIVDHSQLKLYTSGTVELKQGREFTTPGVKTVEVRYNGKKVDTFDVMVIKETEKNIVRSGNYYMQIYGKYLYPKLANGVYWLELSDQKPDKPFKVKLINYSENHGPMYTIAYDGDYIKQLTSKDGNQLQSSNIAHAWRINKYSAFCTIRDYGNQKLLVNASGQHSRNGTKVTVWTYTGSAPEHAKIKFIKAD